MYNLVALIEQPPPEPAPPQKEPPPFDSTIFILFAAIVVAFYFLLLRPMKQRDKKERDELFAKLKKNDEVLTASGIIGLVAQIKDDEVILKVDESSNVRLRVLKSSIARIMNPKEAAAPDGVKAGSPPAGK